MEGAFVRINTIHLKKMQHVILEFETCSTAKNTRVTMVLLAQCQERLYLFIYLYFQTL